MAKRLSRLEVDEVSTVDKAANNKRFLILKRAEPAASEQHGGQDMKPDEIKQAVMEAAEEVLAPVFKRLEMLEAAVVADEPEVETPVVKSVEEPAQDDITKAITGAVAAALAPVVKRIDDLEVVRGVRKSATPSASEGGSMWGGIF
jgi:hypothetical protein